MAVYLREGEKMPDQDFEYDVFLSHASEDTAWCEKLAERLRNESVRVWFDQWELQPGDHLLARVNEALQTSRKTVAVWSASYFRDNKVWTLAESFSQQHADVLARERPLIPLLIEDCKIPPTFYNILSIDFRNPDDFDLRFRQLVEALDLPRREFTREEEVEFREYDLDMIVKSLPKLEAGQTINAANLYRVYTSIWLEREEQKGRILDKDIKLALMLELAWRMWHEEKDAISYRELVPFVEKLAAGKVIDFGDEESRRHCPRDAGRHLSQARRPGKFLFRTSVVHGVFPGAQTPGQPDATGPPGHGRRGAKHPAL